jgi:hypothetical protein
MSNFEFIALNNLVQRVKVGFVGSIEKYYCDKEHGKLLLRTSNLSGAGIDFNDVKYITEDFYKRNQKSQLKKYDLLIARHGDNGKADIYEADEPAQALNVVIVEPDFSKISPYLLRYFFELPYVHKQIKGDVGGSVQGVINTKQISDLIIPINHSLNYSKIENTLRILEQKIDNNNKTICELEKMAKTIYDYWFLQFEFPNEEGKPYKTSGGKMVWNKELKREIPEEWKSGCLEEMIEICNGKDHQNLEVGEIPVYGSGGILRYVNKNLYYGESVLIPRKGTLNNVIYVDEPFWTVDTMFYTKMKKKDSALFVYYTVKLFDFEKLNTGTGVPSMTSSIIYSLKTIIPDENILEAFNSKVCPLYKQIQHNKKENQELTSLRDFLLPLLMNGQVSFKE